MERGRGVGENGADISDYNNSRVMDFQTVDKYTSNALAIRDTPRMRGCL